MMCRLMRFACCCVQTESWLGGISGVVAISMSLLAAAFVRLVVIAHFSMMNARGRRAVRRPCIPAKEVMLAVRLASPGARVCFAGTATSWMVLLPRPLQQSLLVIMRRKSLKINYQREVFDPMRKHGLADRRADLERRALDLYVEVAQSYSNSAQ
jgi:hypothetical protein